MPRCLNCAENRLLSALIHKRERGQRFRQDKKKKKRGSCPASQLALIVETCWETVAHLFGNEDLDYVIVIHYQKMQLRLTVRTLRLHKPLTKDRSYNELRKKIGRIIIILCYFTYKGLTGCGAEKMSLRPCARAECGRRGRMGAEKLGIGTLHFFIGKKRKKGQSLATTKPSWICTSQQLTVADAELRVESLQLSRCLWEVTVLAGWINPANFQWRLLLLFLNLKKRGEAEILAESYIKNIPLVRNLLCRTNMSR